jgi:hypothetical protein
MCFINITHISSHGELESIGLALSCMARTTNNVVELKALPKATTLAACK